MLAMASGYVRSVGRRAREEAMRRRARIGPVPSPWRPRSLELMHRPPRRLAGSHRVGRPAVSVESCASALSSAFASSTAVFDGFQSALVGARAILLVLVAR